MGGFVDELEERLDAFPDRHIDDEFRIIGEFDVGRVAAIGFEAPDETGTALGECIHLVEQRHEVGDARIIQGVERGRDIHLRNMPIGHRFLP
jgi:hypothetical protein